MILAVVVMYKAAKKDHSVTEVMTCYDVDWTSCGQYIMVMQIDKNSPLGRFGEHQVLVSRNASRVPIFVKH